MTSAVIDVIVFGQKKTVQIINLFIVDTYDEAVYAMLNGKGAMGDIIIDGNEDKQVMKYIENMGITFLKKSRKTKTLFDEQ